MERPSEPSRAIPYLCLGDGLTLRVSDWCPYGKYARASQGESSVQWRYPGANIAVIKYAPRVLMEQRRTQSFIHTLIPTPSVVAVSLPLIPDCSVRSCVSLLDNYPNYGNYRIISLGHYPA
jgi:hypothetical protein